MPVILANGASVCQRAAINRSATGSRKPSGPVFLVPLDSRIHFSFRAHDFTMTPVKAPMGCAARPGTGQRVRPACPGRRDFSLHQ